MVLQKQVIQLPFGGLQTKIDPKIAPLGTYAVLDNWIMQKYPELRKRDGLTLLGSSTTPSNIIANYSYLNEIGVITNNSLYSYSPALDKYLLKGKTASPIVTSKPIIANTYTQVNCDSAVTSGNNIIASIWEDSRGGVRCAIKDITTDTYIVADYSLSTTGSKPKVVATAYAFLFLWVEAGSTTLKARQYSTLNTTFGTATDVSTILASSYTYDAIFAVSNVLIAYVTTTAAPDVVNAAYWNVSTGALGSASDGLPATASLLFTNSGATPPTISLAVNSSGTYFTCTLQNNSKEVYTKSFDVGLTVLGAELQVAAATTDAGWALATCVDGSNNTYVFYSTYNTMHNSFKAVVSSNISTPAVSSNAAFILQMGVASKAFWYSDNAYVVLGYTSSLQNTYFGVRDDGACFARLFTTVGGGNITKANCVSSFYQRMDKSNTYVVALLKTTKIISSANSFFSTTSVFTEQIFFTPSSIDNKVLGKCLNIAGGYLSQYDGTDTVFEQGFHLYPETPTLGISNSTGIIANGTYSYITCWEWTDNQGQIQRSTPSLPVQQILSGVEDTITITQRCLPITNKVTRFSNYRTPVVLAVYRTQSLGSTYYRVNQLASEYVYNDPTAQTISFIDTKSDAQISSNSLLYTTGNVFENITLPSTNLLAVGKNRVIVAGTDVEPNRVYFSKEKEEGVSIEFSAELSVIVDSLGGDITAVAALDDKIIIFKKSLVYFIGGQGPDKVGNGSFSIPQLVASDCGCIYPQSIVLTGDGIMFQSQKGIYLLDRQLQISYIGNPLDSITTDVTTPFQVTSAVNLPDQNQVFFTDTNNSGYVYDTYFKQWYTHSLPFSPVSATSLNNSWYVSSSSNMYQQTKDQAFDSVNSAIISRVKTNWISIAQLDGFVRIFAILIYGDNANLQHTLKANLYYDFEDFPRESVSITPYDLSNASVYGSDATYGSGSPYGGSFNGVYNFVIRPKVQKCTSIQIELFDEFPTGDRTQSFNFSGISLVVGVKSSYNKNLSYTKRLT
jgi:hypothetical protein